MTGGDEKPDDDEPRLSAETLKALQEFLQEQQSGQDTIAENWQLSQFWYDEETTVALSSAALSLCDKSQGSIALVSCPTLYPRLKSEIDSSNRQIDLVLFEYDKRFSVHGSGYTYYDYNQPLSVEPRFEQAFDVVLVDPPFLSEECLTKTSETVNLIRKPGAKVILCTGSVMETLAGKLLNVTRCSFQPRHENNLANEFICLTNFGELPK